MNWSVILSLAAVLFKSYYRSSRPGQKSLFSRPVVIFVLDLVLLGAPFILVSYVLLFIPKSLDTFVHAVLNQALISFPLGLTSAVILAGILFELGQSGGLASSEAVNWLPVSPVEYVLSSSISVGIAYSPFLFFGLGVIMPLVLSFRMYPVIPFLVGFSVLSLFWGSLIVEMLRAVMNRISTSVYRKSGRLGLILRLTLLILIMVVVQLAFNPYILSLALQTIVRGVSLTWFVPMVWPSVVILFLLNSDSLYSMVFTVISFLFTLVLFKGAAFLRTRYWSPVPTTISLSSSAVYNPQVRSFLWLNPMSYMVASKDMKSFTRRKDMARFLAIPVLLIISFLIPSTSMEEPGFSLLGSGVGLFLLGEICCILPVMLSSISIGQEGKSVTNICILPIPITDLMAGKLFLPFIISSSAALTAAVIIQLFSPVSSLHFFMIVIAIMFSIVVNSYAGLGAGSRYPDFTIGPKARYVTFTGFLIAFMMGAISTAGIFLPLLIYSARAAGIILPFLGFRGLSSILEVALLTIGIGTILVFTLRLYCRKGVRSLLTNLEA